MFVEIWLQAIFNKLFVVIWGFDEILVIDQELVLICSFPLQYLSLVSIDVKF